MCKQLLNVCCTATGDCFIVCIAREEVRFVGREEASKQVGTEGREGEETTRNRPNYFVQRSRGSAHFCLFSFQQPHLCFVMKCYYLNFLIETGLLPVVFHVVN